MPLYPFRPKSTASLKPGDFWALPLRDGKFGCGRVIEIQSETAGSRSMLLAGLMRWIGNSPPSAADLVGTSTVAQGQVHLRSIWETGGEIIGFRDLAEDGIESALFLSESPGRSCMLQAGYRLMRPATAEEQRTLQVFSTWGYLIIQNKAEALATSAAA